MNYITLSESEINAIHAALVASGHADLAELLPINRQPSEEELIYATLAKERTGDDLEVDDDPLVSIGDDGAFVSAWLWVPAPHEEAAA